MDWTMEEDIKSSEEENNNDITTTITTNITTTTYNQDEPKIVVEEKERGGRGEETVESDSTHDEMFDNHHLFLSMNYRKIYNKNTSYHTHSAYDASFIVIYKKFLCQIVDDKSTLHYPLHNAFNKQSLTRKIRDKMDSYSFRDLNKDLDEKIKKYNIKFVWVYSDNQILRRLDALKADSIHVVDLKETSKYVGKLQNLQLINMKQPYNYIKKSNDSILNTLATWLIAGYDSKDQCLYSPKYYTNPDPCDAHKFCLENDKYFCASTLTLINRLSFMFLFRICDIEELKNLIIKLMYPEEKSCFDKCSILETFSSQLYNMTDKCIDHSKSNVIKELINYLGYDHNMYLDFKRLP